MHFLPEYIETYAEQHSQVGQQKLLKALERKTNIEIMRPQMLSGALQGQFLAFLSRMLQPKYILEIGTYTGYSAICLAQGLQEGGQLHTIDSNPEVEHIAQEFIQESEQSEQIICHQGDAMQLVPTLGFDWDLVFIDADKVNYANYYDMLLPQLKVGGYILADNVLWNGQVPKGANEKRTNALRAFNTKVQADNRVKNVLLPLRDGVMMIEKIKV